MPPKFSEMKVLTDSDRRKLQKQRDAEKKQSDISSAEQASKMKLIVAIVGLATVIIVAAVFFYVSGERTGKVQQKEARQIELKFPAGEIFKLDGKTKVWERPSVNKVAEGEGVRTGKGGNITLIFSKNRSLKLFENSEIIFKSIEPNPDNLDFLSVTALMSRGSANFEVGSGPCSLTIEASYLTVKMLNNFAALFKIQYGKKDKLDNIRVAVKSGRVQVINKKNGNAYDVESLNEITINQNAQVQGPSRFLGSSEVF